MNTKYTKKFWEYVEKKKEEDKQAEKVYEWLDHDNLGRIITDGEVYWIELTTSTAELPEDVFEYIRNYMNEQDYKYLYSIKPIKGGTINAIC